LGAIVLTHPHNQPKETQMENQVYKTIQITGTSSSGSDAAVRTALEKAAKTIHDIRWFRVTDTRGQIEKNQITSWQVTIELGFALE
jgi:flavin-binding protein dodecin